MSLQLDAAIIALESARTPLQRRFAHWRKFMIETLGQVPGYEAGDPALRMIAAQLELPLEVER